jgi:hypothetical protein
MNCGTIRETQFAGNPALVLALDTVRDLHCAWTLKLKQGRMPLAWHPAVMRSIPDVCHRMTCRSMLNFHPGTNSDGEFVDCTMTKEYGGS